MSEPKYPMGTRAGKSEYTKVGSARTKSTADKLAELAWKERMRAATSPMVAILYHDIRADITCAAAKRENHFVYKDDIPKEVAYKLESIDGLALEKVEDGTKISW